MTGSRVLSTILGLVVLHASAATATTPAQAGTDSGRPNVVLIVADDMGWGEARPGHPTLETPNLDLLAADGLRMTRFYATPNCSPTRAALLTGRANHRTGVLDHGYALRPQEITLAEVLRDSGYATGHFGKWHLMGLRGPGVPILAGLPGTPSDEGFETWVSSTNYIDDDPLLSRNGAFEQFQGDSSEVVAQGAIDFMTDAVAGNRPFFAAIWAGAPHRPWRSVHRDHPVALRAPEGARDHHGEIVGLDKSVGMIRRFLRDADIADRTVVVFLSDNGPLCRLGPAATGGLRGCKNTVYEGGIRVPFLVEWPDVIPPGGVSDTPASVMDLFPTLIEAAATPGATDRPLDGQSLLALWQGGSLPERSIHIQHRDDLVALRGPLKLVVTQADGGNAELYDLAVDPGETSDLAAQRPDITTGMQTAADAWQASVARSLAGLDYQDTPLDPPVTRPVNTRDHPSYRAIVASLAPAPRQGRVGTYLGAHDPRLLVAVTAGLAVAGSLAVFALAIRLRGRKLR